MNQELIDDRSIALSRNGAWLEQVYLTYKDDLLTAVMCLLGGQRSTAEDVLHDVFVAIAKRPPAVVLNNPRNYLITACLNRARDILRRRDTRMASGDHLIDRASSHAGPHQALELAEEAGRVLVALSKLPTSQREVVVMHLHGKMTFREAAETLGISINTAQSRYRYGLAALRKLLADCNE